MRQTNRFLPYLISGLAVLNSCVLAVNPVWAIFSGDCEACLDTIYNTCPGTSLDDRGKAECICDDQSSTSIVTCQTVCATTDETIAGQQGVYAVDTWVTYCITALPQEMCGEMQGWVDDETWTKYCGDIDLR